MKKFENFCKALANLKEGISSPKPYSIVVQTGIVGLFEICFEQSWKLMKEVLEEHGRYEGNIGSPRGIIKIAYQCDMIHDEEKWLELLKVRNILAHTYSDEQALHVIEQIKIKYLFLFEELKNDIEQRWLV